MNIDEFLKCKDNIYPAPDDMEPTFVPSPRFELFRSCLQGLLAAGLHGSNSKSHIVNIAYEYADIAWEKIINGK